MLKMKNAKSSKKKFNGQLVKSLKHTYIYDKTRGMGIKLETFIIVI